MKTCPKNADSELVKLCEKGVVNYVNISGTVYRNQFCAMCHNVGLSVIGKPNLPAPPSQGIQLTWKGSMLEHKDRLADEYSHDVFMVVKPKISKKRQLLSTNSSRGNNFDSKIDILCSLFADPSYDFCKPFIINTTHRTTDNNNQSTPVWDLSSLNCYSAHPKVCDLFAKLPDDSCGNIGCETGELFDMATFDCISVDRFQLQTSINQEDLTWHSEPICEYRARCRAVELGLIAEEDLNCHCDEFCVYFDDCCMDSSYQKDSEEQLPPGTFSCSLWGQEGGYRNGSYFGVMEVDKCPPGYDNQSTIDLCHTPMEYNKIPLTYIPVSDPTTGVR